MHKPKTSSVKIVFFALVALAITGCGEKIPEAYGLYAWNGGNWIPIAKHKSQAEKAFPKKTKFLFHDKAVDQLSKSFKLQRMVVVRNQISQNPEGTNRVVKAIGEWRVKGSDEIDGRFSPVKNHNEMMIWEHSGELTAGIYVPSLSGIQQEAFYVDKPAVGGMANSELCYDLIKTTAWGIPMGVPDKYVSCAKMSGKTDSKSDPTEAKKKRLKELYSKQDSERSLTKEEREEIKRLEKP